MSIKATVDGTNYSGITKINAGGKEITLTEVGTIATPTATKTQSITENGTVTIDVTNYKNITITTNVPTSSSGSSDTPTKTLSSISATYTGGSVEAGTSASSLTGITVTGTYSDASTETITGWSISGTVVEGENTFTISYSGKSTTITVTGVSASTDTLPSGYEACEYVKCSYTDGCYFELSYQDKETSIYEMRMKSSDINIVSMFHQYMQIQTQTEIFKLLYGKRSYNQGIDTGVAYDENAHDFYISRTSVKIDDVTKSNVSTFDDDVNISTIKIGSANLTKGNLYCIYSFKVSEGDTVVHDLVPCLDDNSVACMYDKITGETIYASSGTVLYG